MEEIISFELAQELWKKRFPKIETTCCSYFIEDEDYDAYIINYMDDEIGQKNN